MADLIQYDPEEIRNVVNALKSRVEALEQSFVSANSADELVSSGGSLSDLVIGETVQDADGIHTSANLVDINWWLPIGLSSDAVDYIYTILYDGSEFVYVGGVFTEIGGVTATNIARYSLITREWSSIGGTLSSEVHALAIYGTDLYVGGAFMDAAGLATADFIAKYSITGGTWSSIGGTLNGPVDSFAIYGTDLYVGGSFTNAAGFATADYIAKYSLTGGTWSSIGGGLNAGVYALAIYGTDLYVGGTFTNAAGIATADYIAKYSMTGGTWSSIGGTLNNWVYALAVIENDLYVGGLFTNAAGIATADYIAKYSINDDTWSSIGGQLNNQVNALAVNSDGVLYVGGLFTSADGIDGADRIAKWDNISWSAVSNAGGLSGLDGYLNAIAILPSGSIIAGGSFNVAGSIACKCIALYCKPLSEAIDNIASLFELYAAASAPVGLINGYGGTLVIASGAITPTHKYHTVDTEGAAATDDLVTVYGTNAVSGDTLILRSTNNSRDVTLKDSGSGANTLRMSSDFVLDTITDAAQFYWAAEFSSWVQLSTANTA